MKVKAMRLGFYGNKRRSPGAVFHLKKSEDFSKSWMKEVDAPEKAVEAKAPVKKAPAKKVKSVEKSANLSE